MASNCLVQVLLLNRNPIGFYDYTFGIMSWDEPSALQSEEGWCRLFLFRIIWSYHSEAIHRISITMMSLNLAHTNTSVTLTSHTQNVTESFTVSIWWRRRLLLNWKKSRNKVRWHSVQLKSLLDYQFAQKVRHHAHSPDRPDITSYVIGCPRRQEWHLWGWYSSIGNTFTFHINCVGECDTEFNI